MQVSADLLSQILPWLGPHGPNTVIPWAGPGADLGLIPQGIQCTKQRKPDYKTFLFQIPDLRAEVGELTGWLVPKGQVEVGPKWTKQGEHAPLWTQGSAVLCSWGRGGLRGREVSLCPGLQKKTGELAGAPKGFSPVSTPLRVSSARPAEN